MSELRFEHLTGAEIARRHDDFARLRITIFRDWPYLYDGDMESERDYLDVYTASPSALLYIVLDGDRVVGAATAVPLDDEDEALRAPFLKAGFDTSRIFYFGEAVLLPEYRGRGLYRRLFEVREKHARSFGGFHTVAFCGVVRPDDHPLKPADAQPLDDVWRHFGFAPADNLVTQFGWRDVGESEETDKPMRFWLKTLD